MTTKFCSLCKKELEISNFTKSRYSKDGLRYQCKSCNYEYTKRGDRDKWNQSYYAKHKQRDPQHYMWKQARHRAKEDYEGMEFSILKEDIIIPEYCPYLKVKLEFFEDKWVAPSLDRIDSTKGYTKDNIQVISRMANQMKTNASIEQLIQFAKGVLEVHAKEDI